MRPIALAAALCALALAALPACLLPDDEPRISIEFGAVPELEGAEVLVDGEAVGTLKVTGRATRVAFPVSRGTHEVTLRHPQFECRPTTVKAELAAQKIRLLAEISELGVPGGTKPRVMLR